MAIHNIAKVSLREEFNHDVVLCITPLAEGTSVSLGFQSSVPGSGAINMHGYVVFKDHPEEVISKFRSALDQIEQTFRIK